MASIMGRRESGRSKMQNVVQFEEKTGEIQCRDFDVMMMMLGTAEIDDTSRQDTDRR